MMIPSDDKKVLRKYLRIKNTSQLAVACVSIFAVFVFSLFHQYLFIAFVFVFDFVVFFCLVYFLGNEIVKLQNRLSK